MSIPAVLVPLIPELVEFIESVVSAGHDPKIEIPRLRLSYEAQTRVDEAFEKSLEARFGKAEKPETD